MVGTKGFGFKLLVLSIVIAINSLIVLYLFKDSLNLPVWLDRILVHTASFSNAIIENQAHVQPTIKLKNSDLKLLPTEAKVENEMSFSKTSDIVHFDHASAPEQKCFDKRPPPKQKTLYTWIDKKGVKHISDKPKSLDQHTSVKVVGTIDPEAISLNYLSHNLSFEIKSALQSRIKQVAQMLGTVTPKNLIVPVTANIRTFKALAAYTEYSNRSSSPNQSNTGYYSARNNESVVFVRTEEQALNTLVHEVTHTINRHWYGRMGKWLNEGIAEYAENISDVKASGWVGHIRKNGLLPLHTLLSSSREEWQIAPQSHYATSWAFVAFLMAQDRDFLSRLLLQEAENGCHELSIEDVERLYGQSLEHLQREFLLWTKRRKL